MNAPLTILLAHSVDCGAVVVNGDTCERCGHRTSANEVAEIITEALQVAG